MLELLAQFDPFMEEHLKPYGNPGRGKVSYLSANICEELIQVMGKQLLRTIVDELVQAK